MAQVNEHVLKLSGKATLPEAVLNTHAYSLLIDGSITSVTESDNHDGTVNVYYKFEPVLVQMIKDNGDTIKAKDIRSQSKKLRNLLYKIWEENGIPGEFEPFYEKVMNYILIDAENIVMRAVGSIR